jgi:diguanylate cyclase (GGDEF)-like protein/PAS domain S-box-containing protein
LFSLPRVSFRGLLLVALGLIGVAVIAIAVTIVALRDDAINDALNDTGNIATVLAEQTARSVQAIDIATSEIAERFSEAGRLPDKSFEALLRSQATHQFLVDRLSRLSQTDFISLIDKDGRHVSSSRGWPAAPANLSDRDYFIYARDHPGSTLFVSELVRNRVSHQRNIFFGKRITGPNGEFLGLVLAGIKPSYFQHLYESLTSVRKQSFVLLRTDGTVLVRHPDPQDLTGRKLPANSKWHALVRAGGGHFNASGAFDGTPRLIAVRPLNDFPLVVNVAIPASEALAAWKYRAMTIGLGTALALICSLLLIYALYHQFAQLHASKASLVEREARLAEKTAELEEANTRIDTAIDNMVQGLVMFNAAQELVVCNARFVEIYSLPPDRIKPGISIRRVLELRIAAGTFFDDIDAYIDELTTKMRAGEPMVKLVEFGDGRTFCVTNKPTGGGAWVATHEDITERRRDEKELQRARNMLRAVVENIPEMLVVKDAHSGHYVFINRAGEQLLGATKDELIGKTTEEIFPKDQADQIVARDREALRTGQLTADCHVTRTLDGRLRDVSSKRVAIGGKDSEPEYLLTVIEDVTERKRNETRIAHLAHHDPLTDLANRAALNHRLAETIAQAAAANEKFALLCIDLDRFKEVNDLYGHAAGDNVLLEIAARMKDAAAGAFLSRLGGDEFMAICVDGTMPDAATATARRLVDSVSGDIDCDGRKVRIGMSIGVAMYPSDGTDTVTLLRNADAALYRAKAEGRGAIRFFEADMDRMLHDRRALQADLALAVSRNELQLFYQPQARVAGQIVGFEALLRWDHLRRGFVPPDTFVPLAEESGLIDQIGEWVLREACREAASWRKPLQIAINLSPVQLRQADLVPLVHSVLIETGLAPDRLVLEITEGALMDDYSRAVSILRRLKTLGVRIAMDDFGTGYSSLSYLQSFPFDKIKIDQTFIANLDRNAHSAAIVRAVLGLGRSLNLTTVAEGVETQAQLAILRNEGCDEMQGYLIGRPQPIGDYADMAARPAKDRRVAATG